MGENWPEPSQGAQPARLLAPLELKVPAGQLTSAVPFQYCPGGVDTHELAPAPLWPPEQPEQVSTAPVEKVLVVQGEVEIPLLAPFLVTLVPAVLVEQYADPTDE